MIQWRRRSYTAHRLWVVPAVAAIDLFVDVLGLGITSICLAFGNNLVGVPSNIKTGSCIGIAQRTLATYPNCW